MCFNICMLNEKFNFPEYVVTYEGAVKLHFIYAQVHTLMILLT